MAETADQILVLFKHWLVGLVPIGCQPVFSAVISMAAIIGGFAGLFAVTTILERKGLGRIQNRYGPNRVGPFGLLQPLADGVKSLTKEDIIPRTADRVVHFIAPLVLVVPVFLTLSVIPMGRGMQAIDIDAGMLFFFSIGAATELSVFMAGWSSHNKYSLLGAMRAVAQMISYEVPLILSTIGVIMIAGTLSPARIVEAQSGWAYGLPSWYVLTPWGFAGFLLFLVAGMAESNRSPFDLPEGESEIVAGYFIEYSGFKFALFFLGEYIGMFAIAGMAITLFLGGWNAPLAILDSVPSFIWFFAKLLALVCFFIWVRGTLPRLRMDQLMNFAWKFMLPLSLLNIVAAAVWHFMEPGVVRWGVGIALVAVPYFAMGHSLLRGKGVAKRQYRFAE
jgi:NADH-quinone oxidoreductase subunit H